MIRVRMELLPGGVDDPAQNELLGEIHIANDLIKSMFTEGQRGTYNCVIYKKRRSPWKRVKIRDYARKAYHPWELVRLVLNEAARQNKGHL